MMMDETYTTASSESSIITRAKRDKGKIKKMESSTRRNKVKYCDIMDHIAKGIELFNTTQREALDLNRKALDLKREALDIKILFADTSKMDQRQLAVHNSLLEEVVKRRGLM